MSEELKSSKANSELFKSVYDDTTYFVDNIVKEYDIFKIILDKMKSGNATVELKKRYLLRAIDETWVSMVEDTLPCLDTIIRNPSKFIEDKEELIPTELVRKVTPRALQHLAQHTNLILKIEGDNIIPAKLLNVYKEETYQTYENRFVNTLINRLYLFVNRRYEIAKIAGQDEKTTSLTFNDSFNHDNVRVKFNLKLELAEDSGVDEKVERNYSYTTDLWHRVERLNSIVTEYANSEFTEIMGKSFIRPPVMKTNAILKNKNLHQCLLLWQFIESYEGAGYSMLIQENLENIDEGYLKELYSTLAVQYMIFRYNIKNEFEVDSTLASQLTNEEIRPIIVDELKKIVQDEFDLKEEEPERLRDSKSKVRYNTLTPDDELLAESLDVALKAAFIIRNNGDEIIYDGGDVKEPEPEEDEPVYDETSENKQEETTSVNNNESIVEEVSVENTDSTSTNENIDSQENETKDNDLNLDEPHVEQLKEDQTENILENDSIDKDPDDESILEEVDKKETILNVDVSNEDQNYTELQSDEDLLNNNSLETLDEQ